MSTGSFVCKEHPDAPGPSHETIQAMLDFQNRVNPQPGVSHHDLNCAVHAARFMKQWSLTEIPERSRIE